MHVCIPYTIGRPKPRTFVLTYTFYFTYTSTPKKHTQILYFLSVSHADALDPSELHSFLHDLHGCLGPLLAAQRSLLSLTLHPLLPCIARLTKHGARLFVELQKRAPLAPFRGGVLRAFLELCHTELEGAAR